jgi:hypothetical protein
MNDTNNQGREPAAGSASPPSGCSDAGDGKFNLAMHIYVGLVWAFIAAQTAVHGNKWVGCAVAFGTFGIGILTGRRMMRRPNRADQSRRKGDI